VALGRIGAEEAIPALAEAYLHDDEQVQDTPADLAEIEARAVRRTA
jgi:hypothetical protein